MATKPNRTAIYCRVSTSEQNVDASPHPSSRGRSGRRASTTGGPNRTTAVCRHETIVNEVTCHRP